MAISDGDQMQASIQLVNGTANQWIINITDTTNPQTFQNTFTYNSSQLTAEWIVERPTILVFNNKQISTLANFTSVTFTNCTAAIGSFTDILGNFSLQALDMYTSGSPANPAVQLTDVSELTPDGAEFTVTYVASG